MLDWALIILACRSVWYRGYLACAILADLPAILEAMIALPPLPHTILSWILAFRIWVIRCKPSWHGFTPLCFFFNITLGGFMPCHFGFRATHYTLLIQDCYWPYNALECYPCAFGLSSPWFFVSFNLYILIRLIIQLTGFFEGLLHAAFTLGYPGCWCYSVV